jgi:hypothetical protein
MSSPIPASFERSLRIVDELRPALAARVRGATGVLLGDLARSEHPRAFSSACLAPAGIPLEWGFTSDDAAVRYTVEAAPPELDPGMRLAHAEELVARLGAKPMAPDLRALLAGFQRRGALRYGAWIGGRHDEAGDRYKLYAEVPREAAEEAERLLDTLHGSPPTLKQPAGVVQLVGVDLSSDRIELYHRVEHLRPLDLRTLLARVGAGERHEEVKGLLSEMYRLPLHLELPGPVSGFSYSMIRGQPAEEAVFTFFSFARSLCGPDGRVRTATLALARRRGWDFSLYERMSEPVQGSNAPLSRHGLFAISVRRGQPAAASIALSPPGGHL